MGRSRVAPEGSRGRADNVVCRPEDARRHVMPARGNCLSDRRQVFNFTPVLEMPSFQKTALRYVASGWRLSTIYRYTTGEFQSIVAGSNTQRSDATEVWTFRSDRRGAWVLSAIQQV